jgi:hypothetical protein
VAQTKDKEVDLAVPQAAKSLPEAYAENHAILKGIPADQRKAILDLTAQQAAKSLPVLEASAENLAIIAGIPADQRKAFCDEVKPLILQAASNALNQRFAQVMAQEQQFEELEEAILATRHAWGRLSPIARLFFMEEVKRAYHNVRGQRPTDKSKTLPITLILKAFGLAAARIANKDPNRKAGKGGEQNWAFQGFVRALWRCADKYGGKLIASCKNNVGSGAMFKALEALRPYFATHTHINESFVKPALGGAQTIANIVSAERKKAHRH